MEQVKNRFRSLIEAWRQPQQGLPGVIRWGKYYRGDGSFPGVRKQDSLQHSHSISVLGIPFMHELWMHHFFDLLLVHQALLIHDVGEGITNEDHAYLDKNPSHDVAEYIAFHDLYFGAWGEIGFARLERAFLLQFALKGNHELFPDRARGVLAFLRDNYAREARVFDAIERLDYLFYALEQHIFCPSDASAEIREICARGLVQTLRNQIPALNRLASELPGLAEVIWSSEIVAELREFLKPYEGQWIEVRTS